MSDESRQMVLDREAVIKLGTALMVDIRAHYQGEREPSRERVFEVLNALAVCAATVLTGTANDRERERHPSEWPASFWFLNSVWVNIRELIE